MTKVMNSTEQTEKYRKCLDTPIDSFFEPDFCLAKDWADVLSAEFKKKYFNELTSFLESEVQKNTPFYPSKEKIFNALNFTPLKNVKVVILGQDPYHGINQAHGLCFSVPRGIRPPPSLMNIFKELISDIKIAKPAHGELTHWAKQGVLLLNATLTVEAEKAGSHQKKGWESFTDKIIHILNDEKENLVFLLWGSFAQKKASFIDRKKHLVLEAPHPSPLSAHRGFLGCKHFSKTNEYLKSHKISPIDWSVP